MTASAEDSYDLNRFVTAQNPIYERVRAELKAGEKRSHWIWFVFPQIAGLGRSRMAQRYAISRLDEAKAYLAHPALAAWLFTATRNAAIKLVLAEQRRRERETAAMNDAALESAAAEPPVDWSVVAPVLESALDELNEADRTAVVLRYFQQRSFAEIAVALRTKENAARMRTERALEKLRERLAAKPGERLR